MEPSALKIAVESAESRALDPNVRQRRASDPGESVWVGASAGTGKTKVLTDRVLRLLLPRPDGRPGTPPHRILCLTFTKAAASEMVQRISKTLGRWAVMEESELAGALEKLTGRPPGADDIRAARRLFAAVVDAPGGLKMMTIHAFCQSVLGRFPVEAGVSPHFSILDDGPAQELLARARDTVLEQARSDPETLLGKAILRIAADQNEEQFGKLLRSLCGERMQLARCTSSPEILQDRLCALLSVEPGETEDTLLRRACAGGAFDADGLWRACRALADGTDTDVRRGQTIQLWLEGGEEERVGRLPGYRAQFLTQKGEITKKLLTKGVAAACPDAEESLTQEAVRLYDLAENLKGVRCAAMTGDLMRVGQAILDIYRSLKDARGLLDYDDLILKTLTLLEQTDMAPWVLYKLDGGLDHVLIDEAQDTNPEQWEIVRHLCGDFFSGMGARDDVRRTIFTVGDEKQSIYSFQRAAPKEFQRMQAHFADLAQAKEEKLDISFRSTRSVLALVDEVFASPALRSGLSRNPLEHHSFRRGQAGLVELWPVFSADAQAEEEPWTPPLAVIEAPSGAAKLADHIGKTVKGWIDGGERIDSLGRPVRAGDIMILVRTRTAFVAQLVRALKTRNVPVSGVDRMVLGEQIAVMDLLALAQFALLPDDDLSLACALKSPLIGLDEDRLYALAVDRRGSLREALDTRENTDIVRYLDDLIRHAATDHPYEFFSRILQRPCPADATSGLKALIRRLGTDALDPLDEFLSATLSYERDHIPTLQGFLVWQQSGDIVIKRELEEAGQAVRIMTVHGAKGLQAPIVILPDTVRSAGAKKVDTLLWPDKTGLDVPLWSPRSADFPALYRAARERLDGTLEEEYRRLLYVALTRAEDRLYIAGYQGKKEPMEECWYHYIAQAFERLPDVQEMKNADGHTVRRFSNPQTQDPDKPDQGAAVRSREELALPRWLFQNAPQEPSPPQPLIPSRPALPDPPARSPLDGGDAWRFKRGTITHRLLQTLPDLPETERRKAAEYFVSRTAHGLPTAIQAEIIAETMAILEHADYAPLFGSGSLAEVPITGLVGGRLVNARIDRLLVTENGVWIVDYKTNRPPPPDPSGIPAAYRDQMSSYSDIVSYIYPQRTIRCFLLWTDGAVMMECAAP